MGIITYDTGGYGSGTSRTLYLDGQVYGSVQIPKTYIGREEEYIQSMFSRFGHVTQSQVTPEQQKAAVSKAQTLKEQKAAEQERYREEQTFARGSFAGREAQTRLYGGSPIVSPVGVEAAKASEIHTATNKTFFLGTAIGDFKEIPRELTPESGRAVVSSFYPTPQQPEQPPQLPSLSRFIPPVPSLMGDTQTPMGLKFYPSQPGSPAEQYAPIKWYDRLHPAVKGAAIVASLDFSIYYNYLASKLGTGFDPSAGLQLESATMGKETITFQTTTPKTDDLYKKQLYEHYDIGKRPEGTLKLITTGAYKGLSSDVAITGVSAFALGGAIGAIGRIKGLGFIPGVAGKVAVGVTAADVGIKAATKDYPGAIITGGVFVAAAPLAIAGYRAGQGFNFRGSFEGLKSAYQKTPSLFRPSEIKPKIYTTELTRADYVKAITGKQEGLLFRPSEPKVGRIFEPITRTDIVSSIRGKEGVLFRPSEPIPGIKGGALTRAEITKSITGGDKSLFFSSKISTEPTRFSYLTPETRNIQLRTEFIKGFEGKKLSLFSPSQPKPTEFSYLPKAKQSDILRQELIKSREPKRAGLLKFIKSEKAGTQLIQPQESFKLSPRMRAQFKVSQQVQEELNIMRNVRLRQVTPRTKPLKYEVFSKKPVVEEQPRKGLMFLPVSISGSSTRTTASEKHKDILRESKALKQAPKSLIGNIIMQYSGSVSAQAQSQLMGQYQDSAQAQRQLLRQAPRQTWDIIPKIKPEIIKKPKSFEFPTTTTSLFKKKKKRAKKGRLFIEISPVKAVGTNIFKGMSAYKPIKIKGMKL